MTMYFPDLESVKRLAENSATGATIEKRYKGLIPKTEEELPEARKQLGEYLRKVWNDSVFALEVELGVSKENYQEKMKTAIQAQFNEFFKKWENN